VGNQGQSATSTKKVYAKVEQWRNRPIKGEFPCVYPDGIVLKSPWGGEATNVSCRRP